MKGTRFGGCFSIRIETQAINQGHSRIFSFSSDFERNALMKNILIPFFLLFITATFYAQIVDIPDPVFKDKLLNHSNPVIDANNDGEIQLSEAQATTNISIGFAPIEDLTGIEAFVNLRDFAMQGGLFTSVDLSQNTSLEFVFFTLGELEDITLPNTTTIDDLQLWGNALTEIDVAGFPNLEFLSLSNNEFTSLDVSNNLALTNLNINNTNISNLDVSMLSNLESLAIENTPISAIDVSNNTSLIQLNLGSNTDASPITSLNLTNNANLEKLIIRKTNLSTLDVAVNINLDFLLVYDALFSTFDISSNVNLEELQVTGQNMTSLDLSQNVALTGFALSDAQITNIDLSQNTALEALNIGFVPIVDLDLSQNTLLTNLTITETALASLDLSQNTQLDDITLWFTPLATIDLSTITALTFLRIGGGAMTSIDYPDNNFLLQAWFYYTSFETLDFSALDNLCQVVFRYNLSLTSFNIKNGNNAALVSGNSCGDGSSTFSIRNNPNLRVICVDDAVFAANNLPFISSYITYVDDCSITSNDLNTLEGLVSYDLDNNGCSSGDLPLESILVNSTDGTNNFAVASQPTGDYGLSLSENTYTTNVVGLSSYFTVSPMDVVDTFVGFNQTEQQDFCVQPAGSFNDLNISINPHYDPVPGSRVSYSVVSQNAGTTQLNGVVTLNFDSERVSFFGADPIPTGQTSSSVSWDLGAIQVFSTEVIEVSFDVADTPVNIPGDILNYSATIEPISGDETPDDNQFNFSHVVSVTPFFDAMTVVQGRQVLVEDAEEYLNYVVNFENTSGTTISDVFIHSLLESNLDFSSIQIIDSSHPVRFNMFNNEVHFWMEDINLPDEGIGGGSGYVAYKIRPIQGLGIGDVVTHTASIHMDALAPVFSNTVTTTFVAELSTTDVAKIGISLYPNPTDGFFTIQATEPITEVTVFSILGQEVFRENRDSEIETLDISSESAGTYFVRVTMLNSYKVFQIIKK